MTARFAILLLLTVGVNTGVGIIAPVVPNLLKDVGFSTALLSLPFLVLVAARVVSKAWVGRALNLLSHRALLSISFGVYAVVFTLYPMLTQAWAFIAVRVLEGITEGIASTILVDLAIALTSKSDQRGRLMGYFSASFGMGFILGPAIGSLTYRYLGLTGMFLTGAAVGVLGTVGALLIGVKVDKKGAKGRGIVQAVVAAWGYRRLLPYYTPQIMRRALFFSLMIVLPLFAREVLGLDARNVGVFFTGSAIITSVCMPFTGGLADRFDPGKILVVTLGAMGLLITGFGLTQNTVIFAVLFGLETLAFAFMLPAGMKTFADVVDGHPERGNVVGVFGSVTELSTVVLALVLPPLFAWSPVACWAFLGGVCLISTAPFIKRRTVVSLPRPAGATE